MTPRYPSGAVTRLIDGPLLTPPTAAALRDRLAPTAPPATPVLDGGQLAVLAAVAARLIPRAAAVDLVARFHRRLGDGHGDGWRYADQPPDAELVARGLDALAAVGFSALDPAAQDAVLHDVQAGRAAGAGWTGISPARWFEEVLAACVDLYYSHPLAQEEIGFAGMADARGWQDVGFGARAAHEPEAEA